MKRVVCFILIAWLALAGAAPAWAQFDGGPGSRPRDGQLVHGRLLNVQTITATGAGVYAPTPGTRWIIVELQGGGGGGAGVGSSATTVGGGGQAGGWLLKRATSGFSGAALSVGAKGIGGAAGLNAGSDGGDTTIILGGTTYTAKGGKGGAPAGPFGTGIVVPANTNGFNSTTGGDIAMTGQLSPPGWESTANNNFSGGGGASKYSAGSPGISVNTTSAAGWSSEGYGGGGSGAIITSGSTPQAGGNGSQGLIIIWEYS